MLHWVAAAAVAAATAAAAAAAAAASAAAAADTKIMWLTTQANRGLRPQFINKLVLSTYIILPYVSYGQMRPKTAKI